MDAVTKLEIEKSCQKIIYQIEALKKHGNFNYDEGFDTIRSEAERVLTIVRTEKYGYCLKQGKAIPIH